MQPDTIEMLSISQPEAVETLRIRLRLAWNAATSATPKDWRRAMPSIGQCAVTALVVQDTFGGRLMRCIVDGHVSHYFNELPDGTTIDLTRDQFYASDYGRHDDAVHFGHTEERARDYVLGFPATQTRYRLLVERLARQ